MAYVPIRYRRRGDPLPEPDLAVKNAMALADRIGRSLNNLAGRGVGMDSRPHEIEIMLALIEVLGREAMACSRKAMALRLLAGAAQKVEDRVAQAMAAEAIAGQKPP